MGQKTVRFSDLSGQLVMQDESLARIVIHGHPELGGAPVEIEVLADEALALDKQALNVTVLDIYLSGEDEPRRVVVDVDAFGEMATERPVSELLIAARPAKRTRASGSRAGGSGSGASGSGASGSGGSRPDYGTLEHAGKPHRGKVTDAEKALVREHLDEINERLAAEGLRTISLDDADHVERYGLAGLAGLAAAQD